MTKINQLRAATTRQDLAELLGLEASRLSFVLYVLPKSNLYTTFQIPKRHGGVREIHAPVGDLKLIQHRLSLLLQQCMAEIAALNGHAESVNRQGISHGFKRYHSIMTNGRVHVNRKYVFNLDLADFFGSINFGRVRGFFINDRNFQLHPLIATVIAQIACYTSEEERLAESGKKGKLPQGSPCSPVVSNLIGHILDISLVKLASQNGAIYTRYADDLTFSCNKQPFPEAIAAQERDSSWLPGRELEEIITKHGFDINPAKTRMQYSDSRQMVTGLTVNRRINVPVTYRHTVRSMLSRLFQTGSFEFIYKKAGEVVSRSEGRKSQLLGMLSYIDQVDRYNNSIRIKNGLDPIDTSGRIELFRRFLYYDMFYAAEQPMIICEGKTDNVYLKCAIKQLSAKYPDLIDASTQKFKVRFHKYSDRRTSVVTQLTGGVGGICHFLKNYHVDISTKFKPPLPKNPVIVLIDSDSGANSIYEAIAGITKKPKPLGLANFIHVTGNVYVVPTPIPKKGQQTCIEDFFDQATLKTKVNGRDFSLDSKADGSLFYGKATFALEVIAKNMATVNFTGLEQILNRILEAMEDYAKKIK